MKSSKNEINRPDLALIQLTEEKQNFLKSADKRQRYINSTLFLPNSHEIIKK